SASWSYSMSLGCARLSTCSPSGSISLAPSNAASSGKGQVLPTEHDCVDRVSRGATHSTSAATNVGNPTLEAQSLSLNPKPTMTCLPKVVVRAHASTAPPADNNGSAPSGRTSG